MSNDNKCPKCLQLGIDEKLDFFNSKTCKLCGTKICFKHIQPENHDCQKVVYTKYIRKDWLRKYGQNVSTGQYAVVCDTCGYSSSPLYIEDAGRELESHLANNKNCSEANKTFLEQRI